LDIQQQQNNKNKMNEPLLKKANQILEKHSRKTVFGSVKFHSTDSAIRALIEFAKYYEHYEHESPEEQIQEGNDVKRSVCSVCRKDYFTGCLCHI
jgi:hypothetical protein